MPRSRPCSRRGSVSLMAMSPPCVGVATAAPAGVAVRPTAAPSRALNDREGHAHDGVATDRRTLNHDDLARGWRDEDPRRRCGSRDASAASRPACPEDRQGVAERLSVAQRNQVSRSAAAGLRVGRVQREAAAGRRGAPRPGGQLVVPLLAHQLDQLGAHRDVDRLGADVRLGVAAAVPVEVVTAGAPAAPVVLRDDDRRAPRCRPAARRARTSGGSAAASTRRAWSRGSAGRYAAPARAGRSRRRRGSPGGWRRCRRRRRPGSCARRPRPSRSTSWGRSAARSPASAA